MTYKSTVSSRVSFSGQSNKVLELERTGAALCFYDKTISLHVLSAESCSSTGSISICSLCRFGQRDFKLQEPLKAKVVCFSKSFHDCRIVEDTLLLPFTHLFEAIVLCSQTVLYFKFSPNINLKTWYQLSSRSR